MLLPAVQQLVEEYYVSHRTGVLTQIKESLGSTGFWFKVIVLLFCAPFWWPIMKAILREINAALRKDGGILARSYTARDLKSLDERFGVYQDPLKSIPRTSRAERRTAAGGASPARPGAAARPARGGSTGRSMRSQRSRGF